MTTLAAGPELIVGFVPTDVTGVIAWIVAVMIVASVLFFVYVSFVLEDTERMDTESKRGDAESIDPEEEAGGEESDAESVERGS